MIIRDATLKKFIKYRKIKDLFDLSSIEFWSSFIGAIGMCLLMYVTVKTNTTENINTIFCSLTKDIAVALIGFLGFTVTGLAILTGVISKKEVQAIGKLNKLEHLEKILLSFYLLGLVTAVTIIGLLATFLMSMSIYPIHIKSVFIITFVFSYLIIFILFYAVKLIGNSLEIFFIVNSAEEEKQKPYDNLKNEYNSYRITALEYVCLTKLGKDGLNKYQEILKKQIEDNDNLEKKMTLEKIYNEHFNIT